MRAAVLQGIGELVVEEVPEPAPGPGQVVVEVGACGVCGSDVPRILTTGTYHFPTIPGHELAGTVVQAGPEVDPSWVGRRAAVIPLIPCRRCRMCEIGQFALCEDYDFIGSRRDGGFAERVLVPVDNLVPVPDEVSDLHAAMLEPITVALHVMRTCEFR